MEFVGKLYQVGSKLWVDQSPEFDTKDPLSLRARLADLMGARNACWVGLLRGAHMKEADYLGDVYVGKTFICVKAYHVEQA